MSTTEQPTFDGDVDDETPAAEPDGRPEVTPPALELVTRPTSTTALIAGASAADRIAVATEVATQLDHVIKAQGLRTKIGKKKKVHADGREEWVDRFHIDVEAWQTLAAFLELAVVPVWTRPVIDPATGRAVRTSYTVRKEFFPRGTKAADIRSGSAVVERVETAVVDGYDWESRVEVYKDGALISAGEAMCCRTEESWRDDSDHDIRSMAQTRAIRNAIATAAKWIVALAGYDDTSGTAAAAAAAIEPASEKLLEAVQLTLAYLLDGDATAAEQLVSHLTSQFGEQLPAVSGQTIVLVARAVKDHREELAAAAAGTGTGS